MREILKDKLNVKIYSGRPELGTAAAEIITAKISELLKDREYINIIFASAPSQNEFLAELQHKKIEWDKINAFHMDEYVGLHPDASQGFGNFLKDRLFSKVNGREVHYLNGNATNIQDECKRYSDLLVKYPTDIVCLGIGENTHLAFNDPHVADFNDPEIVKVVDLDKDCRTQQVNDGCFATINDVPTHALTITMPALFKSTFAYAIVPGKFKANAIDHTINSEINEKYPSTILRRHDHAILFIDEDSASKL
jgi:glucosamine-6-phosphate deaminase